MTRPRAADDFPMIRARMEELRRERASPLEERGFHIGLPSGRSRSIFETVCSPGA